MVAWRSISDCEVEGKGVERICSVEPSVDGDITHNIDAGDATALQLLPLTMGVVSYRRDAHDIAAIPVGSSPSSIISPTIS